MLSDRPSLPGQPRIGLLYELSRNGTTCNWTASLTGNSFAKTGSQPGCKQDTTPPTRPSVAETPGLDIVRERKSVTVLPARDNNTQPAAALSRMSTVTSVNEFLQALVAKRLYEEVAASIL